MNKLTIKLSFIKTILTKIIRVESKVKVKKKKKFLIFFLAGKVPVFSP